MVGSRQILVCLLLWVCGLGASAQQVFVKNQPFDGRVIKDGAGLWVELRPLELLLDFQAEREAEGARINGRLVRTLQQGERTLVSLAQAAAALGAVVREDSALGTVDVHLAVRPTITTSGLEVSPSDPAAPPHGQAEGERISTAAFAFSLPEDMQVSRDPRLIKAFLSSVGPPLKKDLRFDAMVFYKGDHDFKKGAAVFSWFSRELPPDLQSEQALLSFQVDTAVVLMDDLGVKLVNLPQVLTNDGQRFVVAAGLERRPPHLGMIMLLRIDPRRKRIYQVITSNISQADDKPTQDFLRLMSTVSTR
jgi:hypothetical protein